MCPFFSEEQNCCRCCCCCCFGLICAVFVDRVDISPVINADDLTGDGRAASTIAAALWAPAGEQVDLHLSCSSWRSGGQQRCSKHTSLLAQRRSGATLQELRVCGWTKIHRSVRVAEGNNEVISTKIPTRIHFAT